MSRLVTIASGKGGVGKTALSIGLAHALAEAGRAVTLVDGDLGLANVDVQLGLPPGRDLGDVLAGRAGAAEAVRPHPAGFGVLAGRSGDAAMAASDGAALVALLRALPGDDVVLDLGAGLGPQQRRLAAAADLLVVVATEEPTSLTDAYAVLKLHRLDAPGRRAGVLVNLAGGPAPARRVHAALDAACRSFLGGGVPFLGHVRRDPKVAQSIRAQAPLLTRFPNSPAAEDLRDAARALLPVPAG